MLRLLAGALLGAVVFWPLIAAVLGSRARRLRFSVKSVLKRKR